MKKYIVMITLVALNTYCMDDNNKQKRADISNELLFACCMKINDLVASTVKELRDEQKLSNALMPDHFSVQPFFNQTKKGILLEFHDNVPAELWTPWGTITMVGAVTGQADLIREKLEKKISLSPYTGNQPAKWMDGQTFYIDDVEEFSKLPKAILKKRCKYVDDHSVFSALDELKKKHATIASKGDQ